MMMLASTRRVMLMLLVSLGSFVSSQTYEPIADLDIDAYLGRWFQTYTNLGFVFLDLAFCS